MGKKGTPRPRTVPDTRGPSHLVVDNVDMTAELCRCPIGRDHDKKETA